MATVEPLNGRFSHNVLDEVPRTCLNPAVTQKVVIDVTCGKHRSFTCKTCEKKKRAATSFSFLLFFLLPSCRRRLAGFTENGGKTDRCVVWASTAHTSTLEAVVPASKMNGKLMMLCTCWDDSMSDT